MSKNEALKKSVKDLSMALMEIMATPVGERTAQVRKEEAVKTLTEALKMGRELLREESRR